MTERVCITNYLDDIRSCTVRGIHLRNCDPESTCTGCQPREAIAGYLCEACCIHAEQAIARWGTYAGILDPTGRLADIPRAVQQAGGGGEIGYTTFVSTALAIDEADSYLRPSYAHDSFTAWINTPEGAENAVRFTRAAESAFRAHPTEERRTRITRVRCPECRQLSMIRKPPDIAAGMRPGEHGPKPLGSLVTIVCQNVACGRTFTEGERTVRGEESITVIERIEAGWKRILG